MESGNGSERWEGYVDWRNRPAIKGRHGGMFAASFVLVVEVIESMAFTSIASNFASYLIRHMHFEGTEAAITMNNLCGMAFMLALLSGFLCDAYFSAYHVCLVSATIMLLGLIIFGIQASTPSLLPAPCTTNGSSACEKLAHGKAAVLFTGLCLVAVGQGGIKGSLPAHGAEQFDEETAEGRGRRSSFFNCFLVSLSCGVLLSSTIMAWIQDNKGWSWGMWTVCLTFAFAIPVFLAGSKFYRNRIALGSPLTTVAKVILASILYSDPKFAPTSTGISSSSTSCTDADQDDLKSLTKSPAEQHLQISSSAEEQPFELSSDLKCLNRAVACRRLPSLSCTPRDVAETKAIVHLLPIFLSTVAVSFSISQLGNFGFQQCMTMQTNFLSFKLPPAIFVASPVVLIMLVAPIYDRLFVPFARRITAIETGITHLQRIGVGIVLSIAAPAVAATVERRRRRLAWEEGVQDGGREVGMSFTWVAMQMLVMGSSDLFTLVGMMELFFTEIPGRMRSLAMALSWVSLAMGNYIGIGVVEAVNAVTGRLAGGAWLHGRNVNYFRLEKFYWLICGMNVVNFVQYLYCAGKYQYRCLGQKRGEGNPGTQMGTL